MRRLLVGVGVLVAACGPQLPQPDHRQRTAPVPEGRAVAPATAQALADAEPAPPGMVRVDHAWVKDASSEKGQAKRRNEIEILRTKVIAGAGFVAAWESLGANGEVWHVAEGETYDAAVIPQTVLALGPGHVSAVIPGDGGLHLFRLIAVGPPQ